jgi:glucokinase
VPRVCLVNDFAAAGLGIAHLRADDLLTLQAGVPVERGDRVVVGAGTGLGVAVLDWDDSGHEIHPSEAGHTDFAPVDPLQDQLLVHLRRQFPRVSCERVLSGAGLGYILAFLIESGGGTPSPALAAGMREGKAASAITELALAREDALAVRTLDLFVAAYGSFAGNMALVTLAHGGVYIAGGIAPKIAGKLADGDFMRAFTAKGRFRPLLESLPVHVVMNDQVGLYGALAEASRISVS